MPMPAFCNVLPLCLCHSKPPPSPLHAFPPVCKHNATRRSIALRKRGKSLALGNALGVASCDEALLTSQMMSTGYFSHQCSSGLDLHHPSLLRDAFPWRKDPRLTRLHAHHAAQPLASLVFVHGLHAHFVGGARRQVGEKHAVDLRRHADEGRRARLPPAPDSVAQDLPVCGVPGGFQGVGAHVFEAKVPHFGALCKKAAPC